MHPNFLRNSNTAIPTLTSDHLTEFHWDVLSCIDRFQQTPRCCHGYIEGTIRKLYIKNNRHPHQTLLITLFAAHHLRSTTMPPFNTYNGSPFDARQHEQLPLKDARRWIDGALESFEFDRELAMTFGMGGEEQKINFILKAAKTMQNDILDNTDPNKAHPAIIEDEHLRDAADRVTKDVIIRVVSNMWCWSKPTDSQAVEMARTLHWWWKFPCERQHPVQGEKPWANLTWVHTKS